MAKYPNKRGKKQFQDKNKKVRGTKKDTLQDKKLDNLTKAVKRIEGEAELKWVDEYSAGTPVSNAGILVNIPLSPAPVLGDGVNNRQGNAIQMTSWHIKALFLNNPSPVDPTRIRCLVVVDKEFDGVPPTLLNVLDTTTIADLTIAPRNHNLIDRFKILYDKTFYLQPAVIFDVDIAGTTTAVIRRGKMINIFLKIRHKIQFVSSTGTTLDLTGYVPLFYAVSDRAPLTTEPIMTFSGRVMYKDF